MKRIYAACSILAALMALSVVGLAQAKGANFAGTWVLDKSKSELQGPMAQNLKSLTWTITQDGAQITVTPKAEMVEGAAAGGGGGGGRGGGMGMMGNQPRTFKLDGSEVVTENPRGKTSAKAKLSDSGLEINTVRNMNMQGNEVTFTTKEHWTLADGGKTLKVHSSTETPQGARETNQVFTKQ